MSFCPEYLPEVLILTLKRFEFRNNLNVNATNNIMMMLNNLGGDPGQYREKIDSFIDFPMHSLNLSPYCGPHKHEDEANAVYYDLFAVCNHFGKLYNNNNNNNNNIMRVIICGLSLSVSLSDYRSNGIWSLYSGCS
jgi:hypothetical protein